MVKFVDGRGDRVFGGRYAGAGSRAGSIAAQGTDERAYRQTMAAIDGRPPVTTSGYCRLATGYYW